MVFFLIAVNVILPNVPSQEAFWILFLLNPPGETGETSVKWREAPQHCHILDNVEKGLFGAVGRRQHAFAKLV